VTETEFAHARTVNLHISGAIVKLHASRWFVVCILLLSVPSLVAAQAYKGKAKVKGTVMNAEGQPLKDAMVSATFGDTGQGPNAVKVKGSGEFEVKDLAPGSWTFTAVGGALGYGADSATVDVLAKDTPEFQLTLVPLQTMLDDATAKFEAGNFDEARDIYLKMLLALPDNPALHQPIALAYQAGGNHTEAMKHFDVVLESFATATPDAQATPAAMTEVRLQAIRSLALMGDYPRMHSYIGGIGDDNMTPSAVSALLEIAANGLMLEKKDYAQAVTLLDVVVAKAPTSPKGYYYRGMAYMQLEKDAEATADLKKFVDMSQVETAEVTQAKEVLQKLAAVSSQQ
jgi:tetratricopeptide (TPR) repeat protein